MTALVHSKRDTCSKNTKKKSKNVTRYCPIENCHFNCETMSEMRNHKCKDHPYHFSCSKCGTVIKNKKNFRRHVMECSKPQNFSCQWPDCSFTCARKENMKTHETNVHQIQETSSIKNETFKICNISNTRVLISSGENLTILEFLGI